MNWIELLPLELVGTMSSVVLIGMVFRAIAVRWWNPNHWWE